MGPWLFTITYSPKEAADKEEKLEGRNMSGLSLRGSMVNMVTSTNPSRILEEGETLARNQTSG